MVNIDFGGINLHDCLNIKNPGDHDSDYEYISFEGDNEGNISKGITTCINGGKYKLVRRKTDVECRIEDNKLDFFITPCQCSDAD